VIATPLPVVLALVATAALVLGLAWRRRATGDAALGLDAVAAGASAVVAPSERSAVVCPDCGAENGLTSVYCVGCRTQLSPAWVEEW
jgi:hypothetical protein